MGFKKGNKQGRKAKPIPVMELNEIKAVISDMPNIGYRALKNLFGYSKAKLNTNGIFSNNDPVIAKNDKGEIISLTKIQAKQLNRIDFNKKYQCPLLNHLFPYGFVLSNEYDSMIDGSTLTRTSIRKANKSAKIIEFTPNANGEKFIKFYSIVTRTGIKRIVMIKSKSRGEPKKHFLKVIRDNLDIVGNIIILDSQATIKDLNDMGKMVFHPKKTVKHCHNSQAENIFSIVKKPIYAHIDKIENMGIDSAYDYIEKIITVYLKREIPQELKNKMEIVNKH